MKTFYILFGLCLLLCAAWVYLVYYAPAERFGDGGRLGSASSDGSNHYMRSEKLNKNQRLWLHRYQLN